MLDDSRLDSDTSCGLLSGTSRISLFAGPRRPCIVGEAISAGLSGLGSWVTVIRLGIYPVAARLSSQWPA